MITVKIQIVDSAGSTVEVENSYEGFLLDRNLDEVESLMCNIKQTSIASSEEALLYLNQSDFTKKK